jgi:hypothetical protein
MNTMPVHYLESIRLEFGNGRIWEINIKEQLANSHSDIVANKLVETFAEYKEDIKKIDFKIDIERLKKDILNQSNDFFK